MTSFAPPLFEFPLTTRISPPIKLAIAIGLAALADVLFWGQRIGLSMALFAALLFIAALLANRAWFDQRRSLIAATIIVAGLVPAVEDLNFLSFLFAIGSVGIGIAVTTNPGFSKITDGLRAFLDLFLVGPFRIIGDVVRMTNIRALETGLTLWFVPLVFGAIFVFLFASANPLIARWLNLINLRELSDQINLARTLFWIFLLSTVWPFLHVRWRSWTLRKAPVPPPLPADAAEPAAELPASASDLPNLSSDLPSFFGADAILRSLILFNVLFAIQTVLDLVFLWGNAKLPDGISYADYAHRGAYPLIVTALLAAGFVLAAMRPRGPAQTSAIIRPLVYLWVGQNVLLVISSMLRLYRYMEIYLLTGWRIAALVWMLLVAIGLVLIVARIILEQSNGWLVRMNLITLLATLYVCSLVNFDAIIADYNVTHSKEAAGKGVNLDLNYLYTLGPQALPALQRAAQLPGITVRDCGRGRLVSNQAADMASWRSWGFRSWRLQRWLDAHPDTPATAG
jgi:hypothetical protein